MKITFDKTTVKDYMGYMSIFKKDKKYQTIDVTTSLDIVDNSFIYKTAKDINHLCKVLKNQAKNGADIQGFLYVKRNQ